MCHKMSNVESDELMVDLVGPMQMTLDFSCGVYIQTVNALLKSRCGLTAYDLVDSIFADCHRHGLAPAEAAEMFMADNAGLLDADE